MLKRFMTKIMTLGLRKNDPDGLKRRITILNALSFAFSFVCAFYVPLFYAIELYWVSALTVLTVISYGLPMLMSHKRWFDLARIWSYSTMALAAFIYPFLLGKEYLIQLALFPSAALPYIYFGNNRKYLIYGLSSISAFLFTAQFLLLHSTKTETVSMDSPIFAFNVIMILTSFILTGLGLYGLNLDARNAESELIDSNGEKRKLISLLCHDIANPLTAAMGGSYIMKKRAEQGREIDDVLKKIDQCHENIKEIIDSVRYLEAHEIGKFKIELTHVNPIAVIDECAMVFESRLKQKNLKIRLKSYLDPHVGVLAEATTLRNNVLNNLISNAIKFSPHDSCIDIGLRTEGDKIIMSVRDAGIGMPAALQARIFDSHAETTRTGLDGEKGTGFGLPLVKTMIEKYGGDIHVDSRDIQHHPHDHGTTFDIVLQKSVEELQQIQLEVG